MPQHVYRNRNLGLCIEIRRFNDLTASKLHLVLLWIIQLSFRTRTRFFPADDVVLAPTALHTISHSGTS